MIPAIKSNEIEREIFTRELNSFVPDKALDAHAHMWAGIPRPRATSGREAGCLAPTSERFSGGGYFLQQPSRLTRHNLLA